MELGESDLARIIRMKLDPATASGPLITSIADAAGVMVYFGIATQVLDL